MSYIGKAPANSALTADDITDGIISTAKLQNDAVDNTKLDLADNFAFTGTVTGTPNDMVLLNTVDALSGTSAVVWNSSIITSTYKHYYILCHKQFMATNSATMNLYLSHNNGSSFIGDTRKTQYYNNLYGAGSNNQEQATVSNGGYAQLGSAHSDGTSGGSANIFLNSLGYAGYKYINFLYTHMNAGGEAYTYNGSFELRNTDVINYVKLQASTGNVKGVYSLYGVKN